MTFLSRIMLLKSQAHFSTDVQRGGAVVHGATFKGTGKRKSEMAKTRVGLMIATFCVAYAVIGGRLVQYGHAQPETVSSILPADRLMASRPDILDRNGEVLATDIRTVSLFAEPHKIVDADEAVERLATVLKDLDVRDTYRKLSSNSRFQWLRRQLTPKQQSQILALGIPGIGFRPEKRRFYPGGATASHIVGYVNIDNRGMAGMERYIDNQGMADLRALGMTSDTPLEPVQLSVDIRVQNILRDALVTAVERAMGRKKPIGFEVIIESAAGISHVEEIAKGSPRLQAMSLGAADFAASMGMQTTGIGGTQENYYMLREGAKSWSDPWHWAQAAIVAACRTHGILPVDGPFGDFSDDEGFRAQALRSATLGMVGKWAIHPKQVTLANEIFTPSDAAVAEAREILAAMDAAKARGEGATVYKGRLVDIASIKQAEVIVRQAELIAG